MTRAPRSVAVAPLLLNGYALVINAGLSSALGIVFWMLATRLYSQDQVGLAAALISSMTTISYFSQMNLSSFLTRYIPLAPGHAGRLILASYAAAGAVALSVATLFALGVGDFAKPLEVIRNSAVAIGAFVAATVIWTVFALQDAALSGLRRSVIVPVENTVYSLLKIGFLVGLAIAVMPAPGGIFLAWTLPLIPVVIVINLLIFRRLPVLTPGDSGKAPDLRQVTRFLGWDFIGSLALAVGLGMAPLMVTASAGVEATASYHLAWSFAYSVYLIGRSMSVSLVAEGATQPVRFRRLIADTLSHTLLLVLGAVLVVIAIAPLLMSIFGQSYVPEGTPILRVLILSCLPWAVTTIYCAVARVLGRTHVVALVQTCTLAVFVAVSALALPHYGALGVAFGWLASHTAVCAGIVVSVKRRGGAGALTDWALALVLSAARVFRPVFGSAMGSIGKPQDQPESLLNDIDPAVTAGLTPVHQPSSLSDVQAVLLKADDAEAGAVKAVLKYSAIKNGVEALKRNAETLNALAEDERLDPYRDILPRIVLSEATENCYRTIETAVSGVEGRDFLSAAGDWKAAMSASAAIIGELHRRTSSKAVLDDHWARQWIDEPVIIAAASRSRFGKAETRTAAFEKLRIELREIFVGREENLGLGHGDIWPGNLFFSRSESKNVDIAVSGLVDWDTARMNAPAAFDICHLGLTFRMVQSGEELGPVVRDVLLSGGWTPEETEILGMDGPLREPHMDPARWHRAIVLLTWLNHIANVLAKSDRASTNLVWSVVNIDRVLVAALAAEASK